MDDSSDEEDDDEVLTECEEAVDNNENFNYGILRNLNYGILR